jgi:putative Mg2+ transporter-C (MgtC) family protein
MLPEWEMVVRLVLAAALGSVIGMERERLMWTAGLRTHMLVSVGSCLIILVSAYGFSTTLGPHVVLDPSRVAAQVVSGIGFLGAGSIILRNEVVKGLTTAASLWAVAGVGLATGSGLYTAAIATTVIILAILVFLKPLEQRYHAGRAPLELRFRAPCGRTSVEALERVLGPRAARIRQLSVRGDHNGEWEDVHVRFDKASVKESAEIVAALEAMEGVSGVHEHRG